MSNFMLSGEKDESHLKLMMMNNLPILPPTIASPVFSSATNLNSNPVKAIVVTTKPLSNEDTRASNTRLLTIATDPSVIMVRPIAVFSGAKSAELEKLLPDMDNEHFRSSSSGGGPALASAMASTGALSSSTLPQAKTHYNYGSIISSGSSPKSSTQLLGSFFFSESDSRSGLAPKLDGKTSRPGYKPSGRKSVFPRKSAISPPKTASRSNLNQSINLNSFEIDARKDSVASSQSSSPSPSPSPPPPTQPTIQNSVPMLHADNAWTFLYDKTICIFNGEGLKAPIKELNILVHLLMDRWPHESLVAKVRELVHDDHSILRAKLSNLMEETVLHRLAAMWVFFQTNMLPYLQDVFLPLSTDEANGNRLGLGGLSNAPSVSDISGGSVGNPGSTSNTVSGSATAAVARSLTQSRHQAAGSGTIRSVIGMFTSSPSSSPDLNARNQSCIGRHEFELCCRH